MPVDVVTELEIDRPVEGAMRRANRKDLARLKELLEHGTDCRPV